MARIFKPSKKPLPAPANVTITGVTSECDGIAYHGKKTVFVPGAFPGETVAVKFVGSVKGNLKAQLQTVIVPSEQRVEPACSHVSQCGGCAVMALDPQQQLMLKQSTVLGSLQQKAQLVPHNIEQPIASAAEGYRSRTRLSLRRIGRRWRLGYRLAASQDIVPIDQCLVLSKALQTLLQPLQGWLDKLSPELELGHIELFEDDHRSAILVRSLSQLPDDDLQSLTQISLQYEVDIWLKIGDSGLSQLAGNTAAYEYSLDDVHIAFTPEDFTQVNRTVNKAMVARALAWLQSVNGESLGRLLDLYCGIGNFTLPLAKHADSVIGVELHQSMVRQAQSNARNNGIENALFVGADLTRGRAAIAPFFDGPLDVVILDPPRAGALEVIPTLIELDVPTVLYISCNPTTMVRDAAALAAAGYRLLKFCVMDMFPQTKHIETMSLYRLDGTVKVKN